MSKRLDDIARRQQALIAQCEREREELAASCKQIRLPFALGKTLFGLGKALSAYPLAAAAISALLVSGYAGRLTRAVGELLKLWRLVQPLWSWWSKRRARK